MSARRIGVYLSDQLVRRLRRYTIEIDSDMSRVVTVALIEYLLSRADNDGHPLGNSSPIPRPPAYRRGRPSIEEIKERQSWQELWQQYLQRRAGRPLDAVDK